MIWDFLSTVNLMAPLLGGHPINLMLYADDVLVFLLPRQALENQIKQFISYCEMELA